MIRLIDCMHHLIFLTFFAATLYFSSPDVCNAQTCKPIRDNRHKALVYPGQFSIVAHTWRSFGGFYQFKSVAGITGAPDTISVYEGARLIGSYLAVGSGIVSDYMIRVEDFNDRSETIRIDSIRHTGGAQIAFATYDHGYGSGKTYASYFPALDSLVYNRATGGDSLSMVRYPGSILKKRVAFTQSGEPAKTEEWRPDGVLCSRRDSNGLFAFFPDGILHYRRFDTLIAGRLIEASRYYYPSGIAESVQFFDNVPCGNWEYYNPAGIHSRTVVHTPIKALPGITRDVMPPQQKIYMFVEQYTEFKGDLAGYLETGLNTLVCSARKKLDGIYTIRFILDEYGHTAFESVSGTNSDALLPGLAKLFNAMEWRPAKSNGIPNTSTTLQIMLVLKPAQR